MAEGNAVFFEHHVVLWKEPSLAISVMDTGGGIKRMVGGMPRILNVATGPGRIAVSRDAAGELVVLPLDPGMEIDVRGHAFLAGTHSLDYSFVRLKGLANVLHGGDGMFMDRFVTHAETGLLLLHGCGNVFQRTLAAGETILVEPGAFLYKDSSVDLRDVASEGPDRRLQPRPLPGRAARSRSGRHPDDVRAPRRRLTPRRLTRTLTPPTDASGAALRRRSRPFPTKSKRRRSGSSPPTAAPPTPPRRRRPTDARSTDVRSADPLVTTDAEDEGRGRDEGPLDESGLRRTTPGRTG